MLESYKQKNQEAFVNAHQEVYGEPFRTSIDMALLNHCREYKKNNAVAPELYRYLSLIAEW